MLYKIFYPMSLEEFVLLFTNEIEAILEYYQLCIGRKTCNKTLLLFNPHRLNTRHSTSRMSVFEATKTENYCSGLARALDWKKNKVSLAELLYQTLQTNINGTGFINEFPPYVAKTLTKGATTILDPCAGWGGRLIGCSTNAKLYVGFETSYLTFFGLKELANFITNLNQNFRAKLYYIPYEDANLESFFDCAITSPPYYDTELYSSDENDSANRYKTFNDWVNQFYLPLIEKTMNHTKIFYLNIGSRRYPLSTILFDNFSSKYSIRKLDGFFSGKAGLKKHGEGETIYCITKK
jgi:hypothetical protein